MQLCRRIILRVSGHNHRRIAHAADAAERSETTSVGKSAFGVQTRQHRQFCAPAGAETSQGDRRLDLESQNGLKHNDQWWQRRSPAISGI